MVSYVVLRPRHSRVGGNLVSRIESPIIRRVRGFGTKIPIFLPLRFAVSRCLEKNKKNFKKSQFLAERVRGFGTILPILTREVD